MWLVFQAENGTSLVKVHTFSAPLHTSVVVLCCVFAAAWASLEELRGTAFWKSRRHPWWVCRASSSPMMLIRANLTSGTAFITSFFLSFWYLLPPFLPHAQIYTVLRFPSPFPEFRPYSLMSPPPPPPKDFSQLGGQIISYTFEESQLFVAVS